MLDLMYLLLVLVESLVSLEKLRNVGLIGYFEHGDSLDGHLVGGEVQLAISGFGVCSWRFLETSWSETKKRVRRKRHAENT